MIKKLSYREFEPKSEMRLLYNNKAAINISHNPMQYDRTKYVDVDKHFIKKNWNLKL
jgi:hypothetical protein